MKKSEPKNNPVEKALTPVEEPKHSSDARALALPILRHMHLVDIHQVKSEAIRHPAFDKKTKGDRGLAINPMQKLDVIYHPDERGVIALVSVGIKAELGDEPMFEVSAVYRAIYKVKGTYKGDQIEDRAKAFCRSTSLAHVWSYWRESLISTCMRMGLPPILAPLLIVGAKRSEEITPIEE